MADRSHRHPSPLLASALVLLALPALAGEPCNTSLIFSDGFESGDTLAWNASVQIAAARAAADGTVAIDLAGVTVTYIRPAIGSDPAGFFVQAATEGPALFVAVDPVTLTPVPVAGDVVFFTIEEMATSGGAREAVAISAFGRSAQGRCLEPLVQDVASSLDLVTGLDGYESELISLSGLVTGSFGAAGTDHVAAEIATLGVSDDPDLRLRLPSTLQDEVDIVTDCAFDLLATPLWRLNAISEPSAWRAEDLSLTSCPAPEVVSALATDANTVEVMMDRRVDPTSLIDYTTQVAFDNGLTATGWSASGRSITILTTAQTSGVTYTVTIVGVTDLLGTGVSGSANQAMFSGYAEPATLRINELNATISSGCDLVELRVITGGSMNGIRLQEQATTLVTFSAFTVSAADTVLVHLNGSESTCNPGGAGNETAATDEYPNSSYSSNFDTAYDWYSSDPGLTASTNVLTLYRQAGTIADAVLLAAEGCTTSSSASEAQAALVAAAGEWEMVGGGVPAGGYVDQDFCDNAVPGLDGTGTTTAGDTIGRTDDTDTNTLEGWGTAAQTWGVLNSGQSP